VKRSEMNVRATKREWQKTSGGWLWAVVGMLFVSSCRAPVPQAGRYQWAIVPHENEADTIYVIDQGTGEAARWSGSAKKWMPADAMPDSLPDWKAIREKRAEQVKQRAEREKQAIEAREKREALAMSYAQMPLEKQVAWANKISIIKFRGMISGQHQFQLFEFLKHERGLGADTWRQPYKATDDNLCVRFEGMVDDMTLQFGLSHTPIDSKGFFLASATIIEDVKAEIKRQEKKQEEAHAENH